MVLDYGKVQQDTTNEDRREGTKTGEDRLQQARTRMRISYNSETGYNGRDLQIRLLKREQQYA
jgi:hypothetical protein